MSGCVALIPIKAEEEKPGRNKKAAAEKMAIITVKFAFFIVYLLPSKKKVLEKDESLWQHYCNNHAQ